MELVRDDEVATRNTTPYFLAHSVVCACVDLNGIPVHRARPMRVIVTHLMFRKEQWCLPPIPRELGEPQPHILSLSPCCRGMHVDA